MESKNIDDINPNIIHKAFWYEWCRCVDSIGWIEFIKSKDLGVEIIDGFNIITDEKKWALAKIKYGI